MTISHSEELLQVRQLVNKVDEIDDHGDQSIRRAPSSSSIRQLVNKVDEIDEKNVFSEIFISFLWINFWTY